MAQRSKYGVTPPYFGHRKRGCEATSSPFVYHRQSCGDNHCFCFTAILLTFLIQIKLRRTVFSVRRFFIYAPLFVHFVPDSSRNPFDTSSKKHQSQFKSVCNAHQHIRVSFDMLNKKHVYQKRYLQRDKRVQSNNCTLWFINSKSLFCNPLRNTRRAVAFRCP